MCQELSPGRADCDSYLSYDFVKKNNSSVLLITIQFMSSNFSSSLKINRKSLASLAKLFDRAADK